MDTPPEIDLSLVLVGIIGMLLLAVALVVFFIIYQRRLLRQQNELRDKEREHQRLLLAAAVEVQENERRRIAGDLHDDIGSLLSAARLYLKQLDPNAKAEEHAEIKEETINIVGQIIQNTRRITHDLMPSELEKFGLSAAAEDLCDRLNKTGEIKVHFNSTLSQRLSAKREVALYRVIQELVNNTLKHAGADQINLEIGMQRDQFLLRYADDGKGFDTSITKQRGGAGLGLKNIESRISLIDGKLDFQSQPGQGLQVNIHLPLADS